MLLFKVENIARHDPQALKCVLGDDYGHYSVMYDDVCDGTLQAVRSEVSWKSATVHVFVQRHVCMH